MLATINGKVYGSPVHDKTATPTHVSIRIFGTDPENPNWLLDVNAHASGRLAQTILDQARHHASIIAIGEMTRTSALPNDDAAGNTSATLKLHEATITS